MQYYKNIHQIKNTPIEYVTAYFCTDTFEYPLTSRYICENKDYKMVFYYYTNETGEIVDSDMESEWNNQTEICKLSIDEVISFLIVHEWNCDNTTVNQNMVRNHRLTDGRFGEGNKCAYKYDVSTTLICALYLLGLSVSQLAQLFSVSRTTIYSRIDTYKPMKC